MKAQTGLRAAFSKVEPRDRADWRRWLRSNHLKLTGVWLVFLKGARRQLTYADAVEEALCFGWIDSTLNPIDELRYMQLFTRRKPKSGWSRLNKTRIDTLMEKGLMTAAGVAAIDVAKSNGSWEKLDGVESLTLPPELSAALKANPTARRNFEGLSPFSKKMYLYRLTNVKSAERRAVRVAEAIAALEKNLRHPMGDQARPRPTSEPRRTRSARGPGTTRRQS